MNHIEFPFIKIKQPIGTFYLGKLNVKNIIELLGKNSLNSTKNIHETLTEQEKIYEIMENDFYANTLIISIPTEKVVEKANNLYLKRNTNESKKAVLVSGHIELESIYRSNQENIELPIFVMLDTMSEQNRHILRQVEKIRAVPVRKQLEETEDSKDLAATIAFYLNYEDDSFCQNKIPLLEDYNKIKCDKITQSRLADLLLLLLEGERESVIFKKLRLEDKEEEIYQIVKSYFNAITSFDNVDDTYHWYENAIMQLSKILETVNISSNNELSKLNQEFFYLALKKIF